MSVSYEDRWVNRRNELMKTDLYLLKLQQRIKVCIIVYITVLTPLVCLNIYDYLNSTSYKFVEFILASISVLFVLIASLIHHLIDKHVDEVICLENITGREAQV